jgi:hypothetical protein
MRQPDAVVAYRPTALKQLNPKAVLYLAFGSNA